MHKSVALVVAGLVACGGPTKGPEGPAGGGGSGEGGGAAATKPMGPGDVAMELQPQDIKGTVFEPEALGWPDMTAYDPKKPTTIDKQRATYEKTKDLVQKQAHAAVLATLLYRKAKDAKGDEQKQLYNDARQVLRDVQTAAGDKVDEITLRLLGTYDIMLDDYAEAEKEWGDLVKKTNPKDKELPTIKTWAAYSLLVAHKNSEALSAIEGLPQNEKNPAVAYVAGWAKWRTGDKKGAFDSLLVAAKGWASNKDALGSLQNELLLMAGRTDMNVDAAVSALTPVFGKMNDQQYTLLFKLGLQGYLLGGRWADGVAALEKAKAVAGPKVPPNDKVSIPFNEADYTIRLDDPVTAAKYATEAVNAVAGCGPKCTDKDKAAIVSGVYQMGRLFHVIYATAHDDRYYQPAHDLYALTVAKLMDDATRTTANKDSDMLERSFKGMKAGVGTHDKGFMGAIIGRHNQEVTVCYEEQLGSDPKLGGTLTVNLESDQTGVIKGASTEPKGGAQGLAAVASCVEAKAKAWKLPTRAQAGSTRIKATYSLTPSKQ